MAVFNPSSKPILDLRKKRVSFSAEAKRCGRIATPQFTDNFNSGNLAKWTSIFNPPGNDPVDAFAVVANQLQGQVRFGVATAEMLLFTGAAPSGKCSVFARATLISGQFAVTGGGSNIGVAIGRFATVADPSQIQYWWRFGASNGVSESFISKQTSAGITDLAAPPYPANGDRFELRLRRGPKLLQAVINDVVQTSVSYAGLGEPTANVGFTAEVRVGLAVTATYLFDDFQAGSF